MSNFANRIIRRIIKFPGKCIGYIYAIWIVTRYGCITCDTRKPTVMLDLKYANHIAYNSHGRLIYTLLFLLSENGYVIYLRPRIHFLKGFYAKKYQKISLNLQPRIKLHYKKSDQYDLYLYDDLRKKQSIKSHGKLYIDYTNTIDSHLYQNTLFMPYLMHPHNYYSGQYRALADMRHNDRGAKIVFAGNTKSSYDEKADSIGRFGKIPRNRIMRLLENQLANTEIAFPESEDTLAALLNNRDYTNKLVWFGRNGGRIPPENWLTTLSRADFFLACPGASKPMAHNTVEAMAVGTIPVIEYPEFFHPPLEHMRNAIIYEGEADLLHKLRQVLAMEQAAIEQLRQGVVQYYDTYLTPAAFGDMISRRDSNGEAVLHFLAQVIPDPGGQQTTPEGQEPENGVVYNRQESL